MARFYGEVGYGETVEDPPGSGAWRDIITEQTYQGDVIRNTRQLQTGEKVNDDITVDNSISIVADQNAIEHFFNIRYVRWAGVPWIVTSVEVRSPRLILSLGSVYNGPTSNEAGEAANALEAKGSLQTEVVGKDSNVLNAEGDLG